MERSMASTTRDFSRLSVSNNPPPPSKKIQPMDFSELKMGSIGFTSGRNCTNFDDFFAGKGAHQHLIKFYGDNFTVDGGPERDATDPNSIKFLESIKNYRIPEEFVEDGLHTIQMVRTCEAFGKVVFDEPLEDCNILEDCYIS